MAITFLYRCLLHCVKKKSSLNRTWRQATRMILIRLRYKPNTTQLGKRKLLRRAASSSSKQSASMHSSTAAQHQHHSICTHTTLHHVELLLVVAVLQQYTCSRHSSVAPPASRLIGATASSKKSWWYSSCMYVRAVCMNRTKCCAAERHVAPDCETSDGRPIAGHHMITAVVP